MSKIMLPLAALGVALIGSAASAQTETKERDYLVSIGKRPVFASELRRQQQAAQPKPSDTTVASSGRFVQVGKSLVWVPNNAEPLTTTQRVRLSKTAPVSEGRFVQQGKAIIWQPYTNGNESQVAEDPKN